MGSKSLAYHRRRGHCRVPKKRGSIFVSGYCHKCNNRWWCYSG